MLINLKLTVVSRWMGDQRTDEQIRRFKYTNAKAVVIDDVQWRTAVAKAAKDLEIEWDRNGVKFCDGFPADSVALFKRTYSKIHKEDFESIPADTEIKTRVVIDEEDNPKITKDDMLKIFTHIGEFYGLSPWGCKFNYGRFNVEIDEPENKTDLER